MSGFGFADGGIMTPKGPVKLKRYAGGGTSRKAAIFGEAGPEAAVPLPDGRRIPVEMRGGTSGMVSSVSNNMSAAPTYNITAGNGSDMGPADWQKVMERNNADLVRTMKAELVDDLKKMGPFARATRGRFGLNPTRGMT